MCLFDVYAGSYTARRDVDKTLVRCYYHDINTFIFDVANMADAIGIVNLTFGIVFDAFVVTLFSLLSLLLLSMLPYHGDRDGDK